jgi:hypothetical protein
LLMESLPQWLDECLTIQDEKLIRQAQVSDPIGDSSTMCIHTDRSRSAEGSSAAACIFPHLRCGDRCC